MSAAVEIFTRPGCGYCAAAKSLLTRKNAPFEEYDVSVDPSFRDKMIERSNGGMTFPQIFIDEAHIGGCDELYALDREGKLDDMLAGHRAEQKATS
jgi:glutaredoxin 3